jgi:hypothetical protein
MFDRVALLRRSLGLFAILLVVAVVGCDDSHITDSVRVVNDTPDILGFEITLADGSNFPLPDRAKPGETIDLLDGSQLSDGAGMMRDRCTVGEIRALGPDGSIAARWPPPVCAPTTITAK